MIDEPPRSRSRWRERALAATRRRLKRLEIETHRIKAELARLESENETEIADDLTHELRDERVEVAAFSIGEPFDRATQSSPRLPRLEQLPNRLPVKKSTAAPLIVINAPASASSAAAPKRLRVLPRKISPAWWLSLGLHAAVLAVLAPMTYVILTNDEMPLLASIFDFEDSSELGAVPIEMASFEEVELEEFAVDASAGLSDSAIEEFTPLTSELGGQAASSLGQLDTLPTDVGTLMAGAGTGGVGSDGGSGAAGNDARLGTASFFGTPAKANRVVFLVDNSGSMKQGRMETTLFELARSVDALGEKQEFYVVFYSDQAYPMFYPNSVMEPLAATSENKQKLYLWLQTVELCNGGALLKAMEMATSLKPHVVYILSDGDIAGTVTMQKLTQTNDRKFAVHTLGMGVSKPQDAQNLLAIAQSNRGTFQMVRPLPAAVQSAKLRPIRSNERGVAWGAGSLQPAR